MASTRPDSDFARARAWLAKTDAPTNPETYDRIASALLGGMTAVGHDLDVLEKATVVLKVHAMLLAALPDGPETQAALRSYFDSVGTMLEGEMLAFRRAVKRDGVRKEN